MNAATREGSEHERLVRLNRALERCPLVQHSYVERDPDGFYCEAVLTPHTRVVGPSLMRIALRFELGLETVDDLAPGTKAVRFRAP